jgi:hypothetical protein
MTDFTETRSMLKKAAMAEPGQTAERNGYHNMLEQTEALGKPAQPDEWPHRRSHLAASLDQQQKRLAKIKEDPSWALGPRRAGE